MLKPRSRRSRSARSGSSPAPSTSTGATADLLNSVLGGEDAFPALFGDDSYGEGGGTLDKRGFGAVAVEPGDLPGYGASTRRATGCASRP